MQTEGVLVVALRVSTSIIFLFVLFGALEKSWRGHFFIKLAFDSMGHLRGGHVKATVVALAASGLFSFVNYQCGYHWLRHQFLNEAGKIYPRTRQCGPGCLVNQRSVDATGHWRSGFSHFEFTGVSYLADQTRIFTYSHFLCCTDFYCASRGVETWAQRPAPHLGRGQLVTKTNWVFIWVFCNVRIRLCRLLRA